MQAFANDAFDEPLRKLRVRLEDKETIAALHWRGVPDEEGAQAAIRFTKHTLNHWYRAQSAAFDASLAYEFYGFGGPDVQEGLASHREKRPPNFGRR